MLTNGLYRQMCLLPELEPERKTRSALIAEIPWLYLPQYLHRNLIQNPDFELDFGDVDFTIRSIFSPPGGENAGPYILENAHSGSQPGVRSPDSKLFLLRTGSPLLPPEKSG